MSRRWLIITGIVAVTLSAVGGSLMGRRSTPAKEAKPTTPPYALHVEPKYLNFGEAWEQSRFEWTLPIQNRESQELTLTNLGGSCTCVSIEPRELSIPANETRTVKVTLDLRPKPNEKPAADRVFRTAVWASAKGSEGKSRQSTWELAGRIKCAVHVESAADFGRVSDLTVSTPALTIPIRTRAEVSSVTGVASSPSFHVEVKGHKDDPNLKLVVTPVERLNRGSHNGTITLQPASATGEALPSFEIPVSLEIVSDIEATPTTVHAGGRDVGTEITEVVSLRSLSKRSFVLDNVQVEGRGVTATANADGQSVSVRVQTLTVGATEGAVRLSIKPTGGSMIEIVLPVHAHGFAPR